MTTTVKKGTVGELLIARGVINARQLDEALAKQSSLGLPLGESLIRLGMATPSQVLPVLEAQINVPWADLAEGVVDTRVVPLIPREKAERYSVLAMFRVRESLTVAMSDPRAIFVIDELEHVTGLRVFPVLVSQTDVRKAISRYYAEAGCDEETSAAASEQSTENAFVSDDGPEDLGGSTDSNESSPIVNLVNLILSNAVRDHASDVHIEPARKTLSIRYRIDGELHEVMTPKLTMHRALISRLKVMTKMDIGEQRRPQDGRMMVSLDDREVDIRASCMPTTRGEKMALRILHREAATWDLGQMGMHAEMHQRIDAALAEPNGMILVTGPTGSGKTTTLYCLLDQLRGESRNVVSVEDPVEYEFEFVNQVQVNEGIGLSFPSILRTFLRQDPDYIMVGEIRDLETAKVAIQAALTGHLVLSTLHTNESVGTIARLSNMGVDPMMVSAAVTAVIAQRLARTNCPKCIEQDHPSPELLASCGLDPNQEYDFKHGAGCAHCFGTGLRGRLGIYEFLSVDDELRAAIARGEGVDSLRKIARANGMSDLFSEGLRLATSGRTTLREFLAVVGTDRAALTGA